MRLLYSSSRLATNLAFAGNKQESIHDYLSPNNRWATGQFLSANFLGGKKIAGSKRERGKEQETEHQKNNLKLPL